MSRGWWLGFCGLAAAAAQAQLDEQAMYTRSLVSAGNVARLQHVLAKARRGEPVTVAVIGGSISAGAKASKPELRYADQLAAWWRRAFPRTPITLVNAGIGATGSNFGALRASRDLLSGRPDFVVVEYAVNDGNTQQAAETYEGLLRQILAQPQAPAVVLLFMMHRGGGNAQEWLSKVGRHYDLPMLSFRDATWPAMQAKQLAWEDVIADEVHPNDRGHALAAQLVTHFLEPLRAALPADPALTPPAPLPAPLFSDLFAHTALYEALGLQPVVNQGFVYDPGHGGDAGWKATEPGAKLVVEVEGTLIYLMAWRCRAPLGKARIQVDDRAPLVHDAWFDQTWGGWRQTLELARGLAPGKHRVTVEVLPDKHAESTGHEYRVLALGCAGTGEPAGATLRGSWKFDGTLDPGATPVGQPQFAPGRAGGQCLSLDGSGAGVSLGQLALADRFTLTAWFKTADNRGPDGRQRLAMLLANSRMDQRHGFFLFVNNQWGPGLDGLVMLETFIGQTSARVQSTTRLQPDTWHHLALAADRRSGEVRLWLDGRPETIQRLGAVDLGRTMTQRECRVGVSLNGAGGLRGQVGEVRVYDGVLSDAEVAKLGAG